jgi:hypothetical protein
MTMTHPAEHYYLSSSTGDDSDRGSENLPWKSLVQISATELQASDTVYFKRGDRLDGHFVVDGSGSEKAPNRITAYGEGAQPILTGEFGAAGGGD